MIPGERRLWSGRRYFLTDLRIVVSQDELALGEVFEPESQVPSCGGGIVVVSQRAHVRAQRTCLLGPRHAMMKLPRANRVIAFAVVVSGLLAAAVAVMMTVQFPLVTPDFALHDTIIVLVGVVVGGIDRLWTATLGGFTIGFASGVINGVLPTNSTVYLPSVLFALVILVLLLRPAGLFAWGRRAAVDRV